MSLTSTTNHQTGSLGSRTSVLYILLARPTGPQDLTRRAAGRRITPSFLVLQSEKAQPHFGGAFLFGPQAAGPQKFLIMIKAAGSQGVKHLSDGLELRTSATG